MNLSEAVRAAFDAARSSGHGARETAREQLATLVDVEPQDRRDELLALLAIHDLSLAPLAHIGDAAELQHDVAVVQLKARLEDRLVARLDAASDLGGGRTGLDPVRAMRRLATADLVPPLYRWIAQEAELDEITRYLALEGGPDGGFDDLVAICQVGIRGRAKVELGRNYWDEMGRGELAAVHSELHDTMVEALDLDVPPRETLPVEALERSALGSLLATNRALQPEMVGALGFIELQAGPRSREVAKGLRRVGAAEAALPFYDEHAAADPIHGKAWLDEVVAPLTHERPEWGPRIVRGARWRAAVNGCFFAWASRQYGVSDGSRDRQELAA
jgi:hypothetical protein